MATVAGGGGGGSFPRKIDNGPVGGLPKGTAKAVGVPGKVTRVPVPKAVNKPAPAQKAKGPGAAPAAPQPIVRRRTTTLSRPSTTLNKRRF